MSERTRETLVRLARELEDIAEDYVQLVTPKATDEEVSVERFLNRMGDRYGLYYSKRSSLKDKLEILSQYMLETERYCQKLNNYQDLLVDTLNGYGIVVPLMPNDPLEMEAVEADLEP